LGKEGGQFPLFAKLPCRGFDHAMFRKHIFALNFWQIEANYEDGELVSEETLREKGIVKGNWDGVKILANGTLTKKVKVNIDAASQAALLKMEELGITVDLVK
jgi:large subunit ribosomal protein L15